MAEREFNLLDEPWIVMLREDGSTEPVSLTDALERAGEFKGLAGELPTQDAAILRLLLAVLHTVISRCDPDGRAAPLEDPVEALDRWKEIWDSGRLPMGAIRTYLEGYRDRFYLFGGDRPFYQVPDIEYGTRYEAYKLNGEISESENKKRWFLQRSGAAKNVLEYGEAARWLVSIMAYDDVSVKKKGTDKEKLCSISTGWLGRFSLITAKGQSLFETLMLNLVLVPQGAGIG